MLQFKAPRFLPTDGICEKRSLMDRRKITGTVVFFCVMVYNNTTVSLPIDRMSERSVMSKKDPMARERFAKEMVAGGKVP